ncbi:hypothetical protein BGX38DRAFT_1094244 [Terfezia claveryi]|nr:hypothetical protein BGX38DRAFT_1094244 [Terfezia claveryi]
MSQLGLGYRTLSPDAPDRVYPIRSVIEIDTKKSGSVSASSKGKRTLGECGVIEETGYTSISEKPTSRCGDPSWTTYIEHTDHTTEKPYITSRFTHQMTQDGHMVVTGFAGAEKLQRCEDEPIHSPGAVQGFAALLVLNELVDHTLKVRIASENSKEIIGYSPSQLFALHDFCEILSEEQTMEFLESMEFARGGTNPDPEVFSLHIIGPDATVIQLWCALSVHQSNKDSLLCEFELEEDFKFPIAPLEDNSASVPADTLKSTPSQTDIAESTQVASKPLRILRRTSELRGEVAALNVYRLTSQIQEQFGATKSIDQLMKVVVGIVKELTNFHRVMIYQFDSLWNGKIVTELVDRTKTKDLYKGLYFPASDIPRQARNLYRVNKIRLLYDRELRTARLVCKSAKDLEVPLDMTHSYVRAMSPIHLKYLEHMGVRASMSISITYHGNLWGLISCHTYGSHGMRVTFPLRKMCMIIGETASRNVERLTDSTKLQARQLINSVPTGKVPSGYIVASSEDLLKLFDADFGMLSISNEAKLMGTMIASQEALALLEYLRIIRFRSVVACQHITGDYPDLKYPPGFQTLGGFLLVPLCEKGTDFIVFLRKWQLNQVHWAGNPYEKQEMTGHLMPRESFKLWIETVRGKCSEWTEDQVETATVLCLVYGKFIEVWRQKEATIRTSQMKHILLTNASHELRTPLNAIINLMEMVLEGPLEKETREHLSRSHLASKSLIYAINDLLDLTRTEQGQDLVNEQEFNLIQTTHDTVNAFNEDIEKKGLIIDVHVPDSFPKVVKGDEMRMRQCISNLLSNAVKFTDQGGIIVELRIVDFTEAGKVDIEIAVQDTGIGMKPEDMDILFRQLEQVQDGVGYMLTKSSTKNLLGLGIAKVGRIIQTIGGQLRVTSEEGKGSRFTMHMPLSLPASSSESHDTQLLSSRKEELGEDLEVTLVDDNKSITRQTQRPQSTRRASYGGLSTPQFDRLFKAVSVAADDDSFESGEMMPPKKLKQASQCQVKVPEVAASSSTNVAIGASTLAKAMSPRKDATTKQGATQTTAEELSPANNLPIVKKSDIKCLSILVAEDDPVNSLIVQKRMEKLGYTVKLTVNGQQCANAFKDDRDKYDLILMDMQMPIMDGSAATAIIRQIEVSRQKPCRLTQSRDDMPQRDKSRIPILAISASLLESKRQEYMDTGFDGWLLKPVDFKRLQVLIKGISDEKLREQERYMPGQWGEGGWFIRESKEPIDVGLALYSLRVLVED